ncbi:type I toxin-antitoxin system antitoxin YafN [Alkalimonas mucilaginosa]|uniref:Antitoxin n=1 Tax=Alkalimonas mucilaginosa TaxID=3057676 RepID=A0ABU7JJI2_9GAMM|nr:type I toxin-antitoxin system antitoxin YafN [Alkalimonas sp. MEB004]MEE2025255.1 type I toxin-antitoxin system antitoxin YafN [Alkalimonas sp. MEB004]
MSSHAILAEKAVSVSEARKNLSQYFIDEPVAVLSNNKPTGYILSAELYEKMLRIIEASGAAEQGLFRPAAARLKEISRLSEQLLLEADAAKLREFTE